MGKTCGNVWEKTSTPPLDTHKQYISPLLDSLTKSGLDAKIGPYPVPAPTCADDVTLVADSSLTVHH